MAPDPVEALAADAASAPEDAGESSGSSFSSPLRALVEPSPRDWPELDEDEFAGMINEGLRGRVGGDPAKARVGQSVMDCVYALTGGHQFGNGAPLMRLGTSGFRYVAQLKKQAPKPGGAEPKRRAPGEGVGLSVTGA